MVFFMSSDERARHKSTEATLDATRDVLNDPVVAEVLRRTNVTLLRTLGHFYIPNVSHGVITKPRSVKDPNAIPVVSFRKDEELTTTPQVWSMLPSQEKSYIDYLVSQGVSSEPAQIDAELDAFRTIFDQEVEASPIVSLPPKADGMVTRPHAAIRIKSVKHSTNFDRIFDGRPLVGFRMTEDLTAHPGIVGLHETVHVAQTFKHTRSKLDLESRKRLKFERELEAYHYQAYAAHALYHRSANPQLRSNPQILKGYAFTIENLRATENAKRRNPFEPSGSLKNLILDIGLDI